MDFSGHPTPELLAELRPVARRCLVEGGWGEIALVAVITQALKGWAPGGRRWSNLNRTVEESLPQEICWRDELGNQGIRITTLDDVLHEAFVQEVRGRAFNGFRTYDTGPEGRLATLGVPDAQEAWRWLWNSPYPASLATELWAELAPQVLKRRLRSFLVQTPGELGFVGRLPAIPRTAPPGADGPDGTTLYFQREPVNTAGMTHTYTIHWCSCLATHASGRPAVVTGGYVIRQPRKGTADAEFFYRCDAENQELASMANALINRHGPVCDLFDVGPVIYLEQWEVADSDRGHGLGAAVLERHLAHLQREFRGLKTVVLQYAPPGFSQPFDMEAPEEICDEYTHAVAALMSYWERRRPHLVLGRDARSIAFDIPRTPSHEEQLLTLARHVPPA
jgi:hypothetical protein